MCTQLPAASLAQPCMLPPGLQLHVFPRVVLVCSSPPPHAPRSASQQLATLSPPSSMTPLLASPSPSTPRPCSPPPVSHATSSLTLLHLTSSAMQPAQWMARCAALMHVSTLLQDTSVTPNSLAAFVSDPSQHVTSFSFSKTAMVHTHWRCKLMSSFLYIVYC